MILNKEDNAEVVIARWGYSCPSCGSAKWWSVEMKNSRCSHLSRVFSTTDYTMISLCYYVHNSDRSDCRSTSSRAMLVSSHPLGVLVQYGGRTQQRSCVWTMLIHIGEKVTMFSTAYNTLSPHRPPS